MVIAKRDKTLIFYFIALAIAMPFVAMQAVGHFCEPVKPTPMAHVIPDHVHTFVLSNKDTIVIWDGEIFYFNEAPHKETRAIKRHMR